MKPENDFEPPLPINNPYAAPTSLAPTFQGSSDRPVWAQPYEKLTPLRTIWFHPRRTMQTFLKFNSSRGMFLIASLAGIARFLDRGEKNSFGESFELPMILFLAATVGPLVGILGVYISAALLRMSGRALGGRADSPELRTAVAWGGLPVTLCVFLWIPKLLLLGDIVFKEEASIAVFDDPVYGLVNRIEIGLAAVMSLWAIFLSCNAVAEAQGFRSAWMGFVNYLLVFFLLIGLIIFLMGMFFMAVQLRR